MKGARAGWRRHPWLAALAALAGLAALAFALRALVAAVMLARIAAAPAPVAPWMTPRLIVRAHGLSPDEVAVALGIAPATGRRTLAEIAAERGISFEDLAAPLVAAIEARRAEGR